MVVRSYEDNERTIAAISTTLGYGGIAVIKISGPNAIQYGDLLFSKSLIDIDSNKVVFGSFMDMDGVVIDHGLAFVMREPNSHTGEDVVEFHCHGGILIPRAILTAIIASGASPALPGEFTFRAFQNGKMDLSQAEAVHNLIAAKHAKSLSVAKTQLEGGLSKKINCVKQLLITSIIAPIEASIHFPDEEIEVPDIGEIIAFIRSAVNEINSIRDTFHDGALLNTVPTACLIGAPNSGKSSLMNALLNKDRAIVTDIPGTTRDAIDGEMMVDGWRIRIVDTAGIQDTIDSVEQKGIARAIKISEEADLVILVVDSHAPIMPTTAAHKNTILLWNKCDLPRGNIPTNISIDYGSQIYVSAKRYDGIGNLKNLIVKKLFKSMADCEEEVVLTNERHHSLLGEALKFLSIAEKEVTSECIEGAAICLREATTQLNEIIGGDLNNEVMESIFSSFCIGK